MKAKRPPGFLTMLALLAGMLGLVAACGDPTSVEDRAPSESRFGLMSVSYEHEWAESGAELRLKTRAQFVQFSEMEREHVGRLLGLPLQPTRDLPAQDTCKVYDVTLDLDQQPLDREEPGHVELLEAGDLEVRTVNGLVTLRPRHFPGLLPFISGVVYAESLASRAQSVGTVAVRAHGGEAVGAFNVQSVSPERPELIEVAGQLPSGLIQVKAGAPLALRWQAGSDTDGPTYIELRFAKGERELALRCRPRDDGDFAIPTEFVSRLKDGVSGRLALELVRVRQTDFTAAGLDHGELRVTVRERVVLSL